MIEISGRINTYIYRISPKDATVIERRTNRPNARWFWYMKRDTVNEAKSALLQLEKPEDDE